MRATIQEVGNSYGRLAVLEFAGTQSGKATFLCKCECGTEKVVAGGNLRSGGTQSCGCRQKTSRLQHGHTAHSVTTRTYQSWESMKARCSNPNRKEYIHYGGRGITVCERWRNSFENFLADMGERPEGKELDRYPNNDGDYEPGNCKWSTRKEQQNNRREYKKAA
jgi:hypothetical protein